MMDESSDEKLTPNGTVSLSISSSAESDANTDVLLSIPTNHHSNVIQSSPESKEPEEYERAIRRALLENEYVRKING